MSAVLLLFLTVPVVTAIIGWFTNWAAVKMIFYPQKFIGVGPLGWQGVLPRNALGFAKSVARTMTENVLSGKDLIEQLDLDELERLLEASLDQEGEAIVREAANQLQPGAWDALPPPMRQMIVSQVKVESKAVVRQVVARLHRESNELIDLYQVVVGELSGTNTDKLVRLFQEIGGRELKFIEYYGGVFGFMIGLVQVAAWSLFHDWWLMPVVGIIVGLVTNYLAIEMIFRPQEPKRYFGLVTYQGLFPKRQPEIAADYGRVASTEVLTPRNLIRSVTEGPSGQRIAAVVSETIADKLREMAPRVEPLVPVAVTPELIDQVHGMIVQRLQRAVPDVQPEIESYIEKHVDVGHMVQSKLAEMDKPQFERILRGLFEKDEWILITIGGVLGGAVGFAQAAVVLGLSL